MMLTNREMPAQLSEQELISRCMDGDLDAFGRLFELYEHTIYRYAYYIMSDPDDANDIKQDTFVKAYRALPGFRGECTLRSWLLKIAGNLCRDRIRSRARRKEAPLVPEIAFEITAAGIEACDPVQIAERKDLCAIAQRVLHAMPKHRRDLIVLRDLEGLSYQQIAEVLGCSVPSVKLHLFRARRLFKERLNFVLSR